MVIVKMNANETTRNDPSAWGERWIQNKYRGVCEACGGFVEPGTGFAVKSHVDDGDLRGKWIVIHAVCPAEKAELDTSQLEFEIRELWAKRDPTIPYSYLSGGQYYARPCDVIIESEHYAIMTAWDDHNAEGCWKAVGQRIAVKTVYRGNREVELALSRCRFD